MKREHISIASLKDETTGQATHGEGTAQLLSNQFESVFTTENRDALPDMPYEQYPPMANFTITT